MTDLYNSRKELFDAMHGVKCMDEKIIKITESPAPKIGIFKRMVDFISDKLPLWFVFISSAFTTYCLLDFIAHLFKQLIK